MRPTDRLRESVREDWEAATRHAFTDALAAGTLPPERMAGYLIEDHKFVDGFVRLLAATVVTAPAIEDGAPAAAFLAMVTSKENTYFLRGFEALGVTGAERATPPAPTTAAFQALMERARLSGCRARMLAVLTVAEWTYLDWASPHAPPSPGLPFWASEWIELHAGEGFEAVVAYLRDQLDAEWERLAPDDRAATEAAFAEATALERRFFDAAWAGFGGA